MDRNNQDNQCNPIVSVIIPTYNGAKYLKEAILSATPERQGLQEVEIIVVDDQSTDDSHDIAKSFPQLVRPFRLEKNGGVANARNFGIAMARGEYIALLDQDDIFLPNKLKKQVKIMHEDSSVVLCHGNISVIDELGQIISHDILGHRSPPPSGQVTYKLFEWNHIIACTTLFRKDAFFRAGGFNPNTWGTDDYEMWLNLSLHGSFKYIDEIISKYRWHDTNASRKDSLMLYNKLTARTEFLKRNPAWDKKIDPHFIAQQIFKHAKDFSYHLTKSRDYDLARKTIKAAIPHTSKAHRAALAQIYLKTYIHQIINKISTNIQ